MNASLREVFSVERDPVTVSAISLPKVERIAINLDRAQLRPNPPTPPAVQGESTAGLELQSLTMDAADLSLGPVTADLHLTASDVRLDQALDSNAEIVLLLRSAADGAIEISTNKSALEEAIAAVAKLEAGKQGVTVEEATLSIRERGPRSISAEVQIKARKLFFATVVRIGANLDINEELEATVSGLSCNGDGAIGSLACGVLSPHLQKLEGRTFPLMALPLGEIRLRDVRLSAGEKITVRAEFGS
jgi:hypothetical protein